MFGKFTERARRVMGLSRQEAQRVGGEFIGTEHILAGILLEGEGVAAKVLKHVQVDLNLVRQESEKLVTPSASPEVALGQLPFSPRTKRVIELAAEAAGRLGHNVIGTEHLLLGLLEEDEGIAAHVLCNLGFKLKEIRCMLLEVLGAKLEPIPWSARVRSVVELSAVEADRMGFPTVEPEHLLLAILVENGPAAGLLKSSGVTAEAIRGIIPRT